MHYDTFLSYSRTDRDLISGVIQILKLGGRSVFVDDESIAPGTKWKEEITEAIQNCDSLVLLWCCHSSESDWVAHEVAQAIQHEVPIIPILLCKHPVDEPCSQYQWIDMRSMVHTCSGDCHGASDANVSVLRADEVARNLPKKRTGGMIGSTAKVYYPNQPSLDFWKDRAGMKLRNRFRWKFATMKMDEYQKELANTLFTAMELAKLRSDPFRVVKKDN